jgi:predicted amidohydrolase YtcJ
MGKMDLEDLRDLDGDQHGYDRGSAGHEARSVLTAKKEMVILKAELIVINGTVTTMDNLCPFAQAVAIGGGKILVVGSNEEALTFAGTETRVLDAGGNTVLPGFIDSHVHFMGTGLDAASVYLTGAANQTEFMERLSGKARTLKKDAWLRGYGYDETKLAEKCLPTLAELDAAYPDRPVFLSRIDAHSCFLNSVAFRMLGVDENAEGIIRDERGIFTGVLKAASNSAARKTMSEELTTDEMRREAMDYGAKEALKAGVTSIHALEGGSLFSDKDVDVLLRHQGEIPLRTVVYHQIMDVRRVRSEGLPRVGGCITVDGSLGSRTAALLEPYADMPDVSGTPYVTQKEIDDFVMEAHCADMQIAMHTIGDRAIEMLMQAYEKALYKYPRTNHRHRFEHFSVPTYDQIRRAKQLNVCIAVQPSFDYYTSETMMPVRLGPERVKRSYPLRSLVEEGLVIAGGSDSNITPISPLLGIYSSMTHSQPLQRLSLYESLKLFTINGAYLAFEEREKGTLTPGKLGDAVIVEGDIWKATPLEIKDMKVLYTIVGGKVVFEG